MHSNSYVVLARKWRPAQFKNIVGQTHIVRTLSNAVRTHRLHQAYLFTGSRGIGKTSIARIFAKVIRCENTQQEGESLHSCDSCSNCKEISAGNSVDVMEIDGASNNGVEAVREIRESAKYMPANGSRKIYIIDEVHMLTTAAFNALLKTLEEPPAHVIFIFATTEPHKIPATVLSRCQRFDYRRVTPSQIQARLDEICHAEGISLEASAAALISRAADGSMRDALSFLDQVIAFSGNQISLQSVRESIGLIEGQILIQILYGIFSRNPIHALSHIERLHEQGHDLRIVARGLIDFLHTSILIKVSATQIGPLEASEEEIAELKAITPLRSLEELELIFQVLHHGVEWIARSPQPKIVLNVLVIKCATAEALLSVEARPPRSHSAPAPTQVLAQVLAPAQAPTPIVAVPPPLSVPTPIAAPPVPAPSTPIKTWEGLVDHIRKSRPLLASILEHSSGTLLPQSATTSADKTLLIYFSPEEAYFKEQLQSRIYQDQLGTLSKEYLGFAARLQIESRTTGESVVARREREHQERAHQARDHAIHHPIITEAQSLFGGELGPIDLKEETHAGLST